MTTLAEWLCRLEQLDPQRIELGLDRVAKVAARLGLETGSAQVITVAGTNGKGSVLAYLESILVTAGYRVGKYTSPHLVRFNERVQVAGMPVDDAYLYAAFEQVEEARKDVELSYFEFTTLAALLIFKHSSLDVWLLEIGLGGRLDAVNIIDPDCAIITNIGLDHTDWLGDTREAIATEKAGILRPGIPAVYGDKDMPVPIQERADELDVTLFQSGRDYNYRLDSHGWVLQATHSAGRQYLPFPSLKGGHQFANAAAALMALQLLHHELPVQRDVIEKGLISTRLPGRFQQIPGETELILDVAHNPEAAAVLARQLAAVPSRGRTLAVFAALGDKPVAGMVEPLLPLVHHWYVAGLEGSRAQSAAAISGQLPDWEPTLCSDPLSAYRAAEAEAIPGDRILIFGSFILVGNILEEVDNG